MDIKSTLTLSNQVKIPRLGLGVFKSPPGDETYNAVRFALEAGYRHIDTATIYGNEESVGQAVKESGIPREEIFITTKLWNEDMRQDRQEEAFHESLQRLQTDYIDLYLIHWPVKDKYVSSWKIMEKLYKAGKIRAIGVSNFKSHHFEELEKQAEIMPVINQIELHPMFTQEEVVEYFVKRNIHIESWSPLGRGAYFDDPILTALAEAKNTTVAAIILRWHLEKGYVVIPKSVHKDRIISNSQLYDFALTPEELKKIDSLNKDWRMGSDPDKFSF